MSAETSVPLDYRYLVENFVGLVPSATRTAGRRHASEADGVYLVESSRRYVVVVFADKPSDVARFCVLVAAPPHCTVHFRYASVAHDGKAIQGRRSLWDRGDTSPQYLDWGDIITNVPQYF